MPAYYTVVQCVPDPIADERINIGVIVLGQGKVYCRFVQHWGRVPRFAGEDITYARDFAERIERAALASTGGAIQRLLPGIPGRRPLDEEALRTMVGEWNNSIQFSPLEASLEPPESLLGSMAETFLREPAAKSPRFRDRKSAARLEIKLVKAAVERRVGRTTADQAIQASYWLAGKIVKRLRVDLAVKNGGIYLASRALSFETQDRWALDQQVRDAVHTLKDVADGQPSATITIFALPPTGGDPYASTRYRDLRPECERIGARLIPEEEGPNWAEEVADLVESEIAQRSGLLAVR